MEEFPLGKPILDVKLDCSSPWQEQDPGLGECLVRKLCAFPCWDIPITGEHENQVWKAGQVLQSSSTNQQV